MNSDELRAHAHRVNQFWEELHVLHDELRNKEMKRKLVKLMDRVGHHVLNTLDAAYEQMKAERGIRVPLKSVDEAGA